MELTVSEDRLVDWGPEDILVGKPQLVFEVFGTEDHAKKTHCRNGKSCAAAKKGKCRNVHFEPHMYSDCRGFTKGRTWWDPDHHPCSGDNGHLMWLLADDPFLEEVLADMKPKLLEAFPEEEEDPPPLDEDDDDPEPVYYGLACNHGRHRSPAVSNFAKNILRCHRVRIDLKATRTCGCPWRCKKTKGNQHLLWRRQGEEAIAIAKAVWESI